MYSVNRDSLGLSSFLVFSFLVPEIGMRYFPKSLLSRTYIIGMSTNILLGMRFTYHSRAMEYNIVIVSNNNNNYYSVILFDRQNCVQHFLVRLHGQHTPHVFLDENDKQPRASHTSSDQPLTAYHRRLEPNVPRAGHVSSPRGLDNCRQQVLGCLESVFDVKNGPRMFYHDFGSGNNTTGQSSNRRTDRCDEISNNVSWSVYYEFMILLVYTNKSGKNTHSHHS